MTRATSRSITLTKDAQDIIIEALEMLMDAYGQDAKNALDDEDTEAFTVLANKVLEAKFVLKQVRK